MAEIDKAQVAASIREAIGDSSKKSKRVLLKTLLKMYGHKTRQRHWIEAIDASLVAEGVLISPPLAEVERDGWVVLSVTDPRLPVGDFAHKEQADTGGDKQGIAPDAWLSTISAKTFNSEKEVEIRFVLPLLERLGYSEEDRACDYPVTVWEEPTINAFATGSKIFITSGMIKFCKSDDELALVLGHELAHNTMSHIDAKRGNGLLMSFLIDGPIIALTGVNPGIGRNIGEGMHSQGFESEADYVGMYNTARAGFDIDGVSDLWRRMATEHPTAIYTATTHPTTANRFVVLEATRDEINAKKAAGQQLEPNMQAGK